MIKRTHTLKKGDILVASWGYDQTNVNFFQVTKLVGKTMVAIREIAAKSVKTHTTYDNMVAVKGKFLDRSMLGNYQDNAPARKKVRIAYDGIPAVKIFHHTSAYLWDGTPKYETNPMCGH